MKIHIGTSGYGYKEWKGIFYPEKISPKEMLHFYGERFDTVEINYTFYHMPTVAGLASWAEQVPDDFAFTLKAPQVITHMKLLKNVGEEARYFFKTLSLLDRKLGAALFQFPGSFRANSSTLEEFLELIPKNMYCAFEFRSKSWFKEDILDLLRARGCSLCIADTDEKPADEIISTAPWGYLRLRRSDYTEADLSQWLDRILAQNWERAFVFFKHEEEAKGPELARQFRELVDARGKGGGAPAQPPATVAKSGQAKVSMKPRIKVITLGVNDLQQSLVFYRDGMGLPTKGIIGSEYEDGAVVFFTMNDDLILALYPKAALAKDAGISVGPPSPADFSIGHIVKSRQEVDALMKQAEKAGATITDPAHDRFWGGYSGYFQDLDGHLWEIAWNPQWEVED